MKIKALSRDVEKHTRETSGDIKKINRNLDPKYKPMERAREYTRAVQAAKLQKVFAKPFVAALEGHMDAVACSAASRGHLCPFVSGGVDGEVRVWDLASRKAVWSCKTAHSGWVKGVCVGSDGGSFFTAGQDKTVKQWKLGVGEIGGRKEKGGKKGKKGKKMYEDDEEGGSSSEEEEEEEEEEEGRYGIRGGPTTSSSADAPSLGYGNNSNMAPTPTPCNSWLFDNAFKSMDHHWKEEFFATASDESVEVWSEHRSNPIQSYKLWGNDSCNVVRYNPAERGLLAHCSSDRGIGLHDTRGGTGLKKTVLRMRSNCLEWNPMEPMNFVVGNEDHNCYSFDMRKLDQPTMIHKGHVGAVLSIGWSSTGREFVSGSYDRTVRIFQSRAGTSRDCYYTKRMQRVFCVNYTADARFVVSGSDDTNLRIWKAKSNDKIGQTKIREEKSMNYKNKLLKKFSHMPEIRNIVKQNNLPKFIKKQTSMKLVQKEGAKRKEGNVIKHSKKGSVEWSKEREKTVVRKMD